MNSYTIDVLTNAAVYAIAAISLSLVVNFAGRIALSQGVLIGVGAYTYALTVQQFGLSPTLAMILAPIVPMAVAGALAVLAGRMEIHVFLIATLALQFVGHEVFKRWGSVTNGDAGLTGIVRPAGMSHEGLLLTASLIAVALAAICHRVLRGIWGLRLRTIREDTDAASSAGLNVSTTLLVTFMASGALAGLAGALHASQVSYIVPDSFGLHWSLLLVVMCMVGGTNVFGVAAAAIALTILPEVVYRVFSIPSHSIGAFQELLYGAILICVMVLLPNGLVKERHIGQAGWVRAAAERWNRRKTAE